jgi:hypothetical protein
MRAFFSKAFFERSRMRGLNRNLLGILVFCVPILLAGAEFEVKVIKNAGDLPEPFNTSWKEGDILVSNGKYLVLFGGTNRVLRSYYQYPIEHALGSVLAYVPKGKGYKSDLVVGPPYIRIKNKSQYLGYSSFSTIPKRAQGGSLVFTAIGYYRGDEGEKAEVTTRYHLDPESGKLDITSTVKNTGSVRLEDFHYSLYNNSGQVYSFSPFEEADLRESSASSTGRSRLPFWVYPKKGYYLGWIDLNPIQYSSQPISRESKSTNLDPGKRVEARYVLLVDVEAENLFKKIYRMLGVKAARVKLDMADFRGELIEVVIQDVSSRVFFSSFFESPRPLTVMLPQGFYSIRAHFFPAVVENLVSVDLEKENICLLRNPPKGKIKISIRNKSGIFVPGKATFIGLDPTRTPYFRPENPLETNNSHEYFKNSCIPPAEGFEVELPVGTYMISASRGPEYTLDQKVIEVFENSELELVFHIDKVVDTKDLISIDSHMHTLNSDGSMTIAERIKSVAAEGVDVAVSTDHNYISDYPSVLKNLGLGEYIAVLAGQEVTPLDVNQIYMPEFNRFPLTIRKGDPGNGAIDIRFFKNNAPLFRESRRRDPSALIQVNHPRRRGYGYFSYYQLDQESAATALKGFDTSFDLLEVMNGPFFSHDKNKNSEVIADWLHLLDRGYFFPIVGGSDSHGIDGAEPGYARTYVFYDGAKGNGLELGTLLKHMKKGCSFISNGPVVRFMANRQYLPGDTFTTRDGTLDIWIEVQSAPWVSVDELRVIINGERKIILPIKASREQILKFRDRISSNIKEDSYIAIEVLGKRTLFPVVQRKLKKDGSECGALPYALTNPIFIDVDGNGKFDPPMQKIKYIF